MKQLQDRIVFKPIHVKDLPHLESKRAMESLLFLVESKKAKDLGMNVRRRQHATQTYSAKGNCKSEKVTTAIQITGVIEAK